MSKTIRRPSSAQLEKSKKGYVPATRDGSMTAHPTSPRASPASPFSRGKLKGGYALSSHVAGPVWSLAIGIWLLFVSCILDLGILARQSCAPATRETSASQIAPN